MCRLASKILTSLVAGVLVLGPLAVAAEEIAPPAPAARPSVVTAIHRAETELKGRLATLKKAGALTERLASKPGEVEVTLAVWRREADTLRYLEVKKNGDELTLIDGEKPLPHVTVSARQNSQYEFADRAEIVVGALYPVATAVQLTKKKTAYDITQTYVVPPGRDVSGPEVIAAGSDYLSGRIQKALDDLRARGVKSMAYPDRLLAETADPYLIKAIVIIEHSSHVALLSDFHPEKEMGDFLEYLGRRGDDAFDSAVSSAGASGMAQFIPSTYNTLVKSRPGLGLIKDFKAGMGDHHNALKAEVAYLDECLADMPRSVRDSVRVNPLAAATVMAASYNGGSVRVRKAIANWGEDWDQSHTNKKGVILASSIRSETSWYVAKLKAVYQMLQGGYYATPTAPANALPANAAPATTASSVGAICFDGSGCQ
jgi:hypothetical protein